MILATIYLIALLLQKVNFHFSVEEKSLVLTQGVINKQQRFVPYSVIQNLLITRDLADMALGWATLIIENASGAAGNTTYRGRYSRVQITNMVVVGLGSMGNRISIPGLKLSDAEDLRNVLLQKMKESPQKTDNSGL